MHKIPSQASQCKNTFVSSYKSKDVISFTGGNERTLILKGGNKVGQFTFSGRIEN